MPASLFSRFQNLIFVTCLVGDCWRVTGRSQNPQGGLPDAVPRWRHRTTGRDKCVLLRFRQGHSNQHTNSRTLHSHVFPCLTHCLLGAAVNSPGQCATATVQPPSPLWSLSPGHVVTLGSGQPVTHTPRFLPALSLGPQQGPQSWGHNHHRSLSCHGGSLQPH